MKYKIIEFRLSPNKIEKLKLGKQNKSKPIARCAFLGDIYIDPLFFKFNYSEQKSIVYHELAHKKYDLWFEIKFLFTKPKLYFCNQDKRKRELIKFREFEADIYAIKKNKIENCLKMLEQVINLKNKGLIKKKIYPTVEDRIKNIQIITRGGLKNYN